MDKPHYSSVASTHDLDLTNRIVKDQGHYVEGGIMGDVYKCQLIAGPGTAEVSVAVKAFRFRFTPDGVDKPAKLLRQELRVWTKLNHKNIVPFLGVAHGFGIRNSISLISLWMPNGTLQSFLTNYGDNLGTTHRLHLLNDIASGLQYLHSFSSPPIIHGDLNPHNVLLDADYTARLIDFGYASSIGATSEALAYLRMSTIRSGSLRWIAPEQVLCNSKERFRKTIKSDVYSFGSIALQVLSGKQPWSDIPEDTSVVLSLAQGRKPGRPQSRPIEEQHWQLVNKCWASIQHRPTSRHIASAIRKFLGRRSQEKSIGDLMTSLS